MTFATPPATAALLFDNALFQQALDAREDGYWETPPPLYAGLVGTSPPAVQLFVYRTQPGRYPVSQFQEYARRPWFDPRGARVPGPVIRGAQDPISADADNRLLAAAYGGGASYVAVPAHHLPRLEASAKDAWWRVVLSFLLGSG